MKIKSSVDLIQVIDDDYTWRRLEISTLKDMLNSEYSKSPSRRNKHRLNCIIKSIACLCYSHWEGFVKTSSRYYLEYIQFLSLDNSNLANNLKASFTAFLKSNLELHDRIEQYRKLFSHPNHKLPIPIDNLTNAHDNLKYEFLEELCLNIDFDYNSFEIKQKFIDDNLLKYRNKFAHGEANHVLDNQGAEVIIKETQELLSMFRDEIENMVALQKFKKT